MGQISDGEEEEDTCPGAMAAFSPFFPLICTSEDNLVQAALGDWSKGRKFHWYLSCITSLGRDNIWAAAQAVLPLQKFCLQLLFRKVPHEFNTDVTQMRMCRSPPSFYQTHSTLSYTFFEKTRLCLIIL